MSWLATDTVKGIDTAKLSKYTGIKVKELVYRYNLNTVTDHEKTNNLIPKFVANLENFNCNKN